MSRLTGAKTGRGGTGPGRAEPTRDSLLRRVAEPSGEQGTMHATDLKRQYGPSAARPTETAGARSAESDVIVGTLITVCDHYALPGS